MKRLSTIRCHTYFISLLCIVFESFHREFTELLTPTERSIWLFLPFYHMTLWDDYNTLSRWYNSYQNENRILANRVQISPVATDVHLPLNTSRKAMRPYP